MTTILTKKKDTTGAPAPGDLTNAAGGAELAVNTFDKRLYTKDSGGNVVEIGTNPTDITTTTVDTTNLEVTNIKAKDGTASVSIADSTGIPTISKATVIETTDNTNAALRITQLGTSNALLVEDTTNPDATPFVVNANGQVGIGTTAPSTGFNYDAPSGDAYALIRGDTAARLHIRRSGDNPNASALELYKSRGTFASPTIVSSGDQAGTVSFFGHDGTAFITAASIIAAVDGTPGTNDMPGRLVFSTTADGASTPTERMRIDSAGNVGVGGTGAASTKVTVTGTLPSSSSTSRGFSNLGVAPTSSTAAYQSFFSNPSTADGITGLTALSHFSAVQGTITGGTRVAPTNQYGFISASSLTGATNNYGFYSDIASGTGRWNFYANGTADNYFAGQVQLGAGTVSAPALSTTGDTNTGIFFPAADTIAFAEGGAEAMRIDSSGNVGIGTTTPTGRFEISSDANSAQQSYVRNINAGSSAFSGVNVGNDSSATAFRILVGSSTATAFGGADSANLVNSRNSPMTFWTNNTERMRIDSSGNLLVGKTAVDNAVVGSTFLSSGFASFVRSANEPLLVGRNTNDGDLVIFQQAATTEGSISVSGSTVSYNGGHLSRWAQMLTKPDLLKGTVMSNLDEMNVYVKPTLYWTEDDELPVDEEGNPTVAVGDVKEETSVSENEQLNKVKVSDVEGDANVAGVFVNWTYDEAHQVDEINMAMTGDMIIRIAQGVTVARGDLLMSAGDGTAKPQGDDIVRSKTIAKVTSTHITCTYDDGSYCVPCVLMAC